ncbi:hypothetical protein ACSSS7_005386 [Eimeria intestinalis]
MAAPAAAGTPPAFAGLTRAGPVEQQGQAFLIGPPHPPASRPPPLQISRLCAKKRQQQRQQQHQKGPKLESVKDNGIFKPPQEAPESNVPRAGAGSKPAAAHASPAATTAAPEEESEDEQVLYNDPAVFWTPASLSPLQVPKELLRQLRPSVARTAVPTAGAVTPWTSIAASRFVDAATDTFVPKISSAPAATAAREAAWRAAQQGATEQRIAAAAAAAAEIPPARFGAAAADSSESADDVWGDLDAWVRRLLQEEEEAESLKPSALRRDPNEKQEESETDVDISIEPRFIPEEWTDVPRPFANSTVVSSLSASHLSKPDVDSAECGGRNKLSLQIISPLERKRQVGRLRHACNCKGSAPKRLLASQDENREKESNCGPGGFQSHLPTRKGEVSRQLSSIVALMRKSFSTFGGKILKCSYLWLPPSSLDLSFPLLPVRTLQAFWLNALGVSVRSMDSRAAASAAWLRKHHKLQHSKQYKSTWRLQQEQQADSEKNANGGTEGETDAEAPPFPLPPSIININHRFYNAFKLMNAAGWKACLDLPTPHTRLESWRLGSELRQLYLTRFDSRVSLKRKLLPSHLKQHVLPHADAVLVMRDGVVDPSLSSGACFMASQLADQEEVGGVAASLLDGIETRNPHRHQHQAVASAKDKCGCDDKATSEASDTHAAAAAATSGEAGRVDADEVEGLKAVCCSFFDLQDAAVRAAIEQELRFIPEYTNYHRKNTQPFHRGQIGKTSRKYDNDYSVYDYRKLDFGMAKFSALNLAGMQDAGVLIVADCQNASEDTRLQATGAINKTSDAVDGLPHGQKKTIAGKFLVLQIIHVTTADELDAVSNGTNTSSDDSKRVPPATPLTNPRVVIHVGRKAKCQVHQTHVSLSSLMSPAEECELDKVRKRRKDAHAHRPTTKGFKGPFVNSATRVVVEEGGKLHHVYAQELDEDTTHFENLSVSCQPRASYQLTFVDLGAALSRFALQVVRPLGDIQVEGAEGSSHVSRGVSLLHGEQDHSKYEMLHHLAKDAETDQVHKSLVAGNGLSLARRSLSPQLTSS